MYKILNTWLLIFCLGFCGIFFSHNTYAALGESANSVESDRHTLSAVKRSTTSHASYTVHEIDSTSSVIREYISPSGVVFAIAWNGLVHPDLSKLLGAYTTQYQKALRETPRRHGVRRLRVSASDVVVEKWGHMRNLQGRAYAPALLPSGVNIDEIK